MCWLHVWMVSIDPMLSLITFKCFSCSQDFSCLDASFMRSFVDSYAGLQVVSRDSLWNYK